MTPEIARAIQRLTEAAAISGARQICREFADDGVRLEGANLDVEGAEVRVAEARAALETAIENYVAPMRHDARLAGWLVCNLLTDAQLDAPLEVNGFPTFVRYGLYGTKAVRRCT